MIVSVGEAKKLWCPFGRVALNQKNEQKGTYNRVWMNEEQEARLSKGSFCIADKCMAWRWAEEKSIRDIDLVTGDIEKRERLGYCGNSGHPRYGD